MCDHQVYSKIGDDVLRVRLWDTSTEKDIFINKLLVDEGYAGRTFPIKGLISSYVITFSFLYTLLASSQFGTSGAADVKRW